MKTTPPDKNQLLSVSVCFAWLCLAIWPIQGAFPVTVLTDLEGISGFELYNGGLFWWDEPGRCSGEFPNDATIRMRGTISSATKNLMKDCKIMTDEMNNVVRDDQYIYFFQAGQIYRKAISSAEADPASLLSTAPFSPALTSPQTSAALEYADGYLYWARFNSSSGVSDFYRMKADGSEPATHYASSIDANAEVRKFKIVGYDDNGNDINAFVILFGNGQLWRYKLTFGGTRILLETGVSDFAVHKRIQILGGGTTTYVYGAKGATGLFSPNTPAGSLVRINLETDDKSTIFNAPGRNQIVSVTTDSTEVIGLADRNIYISEGLVGCGDLGCAVNDVAIRRHSTPGSTTTWDVIVSQDGGYNLRSDDQWVYFTKGNTIQKISTDAPAILIDLIADAFEVVQSSQDLANNSLLVANKRTFVRAYAHINQNTSGKSPLFAAAELHAVRSGQELASSPISSQNVPALTPVNPSFPASRANLSASFLFQLPDDWVKAGAINLTFTVNPGNGSIPETGSQPQGNNSLTSSFFFTKKASPCLVFVPLRVSGAPVYDPSAPGANLVTLLARARSLLPIENIDVFKTSGVLEKLVFYVEWEEVVCFPFICVVPVPKFRYDPFDMSDDEDWALFWVAVSNAFSSDPEGCDDVHWLGTVHQNASGFNGIGGLPGLTLEDLVDDLPPIPLPSTPLDNSLVVRMEPGAGPNTWDSPLGGRTLAHELGHNYGRKHIDQTLSTLGCGGSKPESPYHTYPFDQCTIGNVSGPSAIFGFDVINQTVLTSAVGGDLMSYSTTRWVSPFTWNAIASKVPTELSAQSMQFVQAAAQSGPVLMVNGVIHPESNTAELWPFHLLPEGVADRKKLASSLEAAARSPTENPFKLRLLGAAGQTLATQPIVPFTPTDETAGLIGFLQFVPFAQGTRTIQLLKTDAVLAERPVSANAPVLQLQAPVINAFTDTVSLTWTSSDPDGEPLLFVIQYSADNGASWNALKINHPYLTFSTATALLPGSSQARLRVIASDGVNSTVATTDPFVLPTHTPQVTIEGVLEGERRPFGKPGDLLGSAYDAEDRDILPAALHWTLAGATPMDLTGESLPLIDLSPGAYTATLQATDSEQKVGTSSRKFEVSPLVVPDGAAPTIDGLANDPGYESAGIVRVKITTGQNIPVRLLHSGSNLFVTFTGVDYPRAGARNVGLRFDVDNSKNSLGQPGDIGFFVDDNGILSQELGTGRGMVLNPSPLAGFSAMVHRGDSSWSAELRISDSLLGNWNHPVGLMIDVGSTQNWPPTAADDAPASWASAYLGAILPPPQNRPPVANAGPDQTLALNQSRVVVLDGISSTDPDRDTLTFQWTQVSGPNVTLVNSNSAAPSFSANPVTADMSLEFRLVVKDRNLDSSPDSVTINLKPPLLLAPALPLTSFATVDQTGLRLRLLAAPQKVFEVQSSIDLVSWKTISTKSSDFYGLLNFTVAPDPTVHHQFFRAFSR